ncbi:unnamed protein product [Lampetra planeri]
MVGGLMVKNDDGGAANGWNATERMSDEARMEPAKRRVMPTLGSIGLVESREPRGCELLGCQGLEAGTHEQGELTAWPCKLGDGAEIWTGAMGRPWPQPLDVSSALRLPSPHPLPVSSSPVRRDVSLRMRVH